MRLIVNSRGLVDFEAPITMNEEQRKKLIAFFKARFPETEVIDVAEVRRYAGERERTLKSWSPKEFALILSSKTNDEIAQITNRTEMSVRMKRGDFFPAFLNWMRKKGLSYVPDKNYEDLIATYLKEVA